MSVPLLSKMHMNGYQVVSVNSGLWKVCTRNDRLGSFGTREEALAYAASLPARQSRVKPVSHTQ
ncbi:SPOR domain-containing protein [Pseudomonas sp. NPDC087697]|uniref:SPOR domain-containing protein n=1 Tax=Pseudomonas sp. NPDC087697 TaxID=3364447 RepID=UPI00381A267C